MLARKSETKAAHLSPHAPGRKVVLTPHELDLDAAHHRADMSPLVAAELAPRARGRQALHVPHVGGRERGEGRRVREERDDGAAERDAEGVEVGLEGGGRGRGGGGEEEAPEGGEVDVLAEAFPCARVRVWQSQPSGSDSADGKKDRVTRTHT